MHCTRNQTMVWARWHNSSKYEDKLNINVLVLITPDLPFACEHYEDGMRNSCYSFVKESRPWLSYISVYVCE